jgi:hypothetical protein
MVASFMTVAAYASLTLFSSAFLRVDLPLLGTRATAAVPAAAAVRSVGFAAATCTFRNVPELTRGTFRDTVRRS